LKKKWLTMGQLATKYDLSRQAIGLIMKQAEDVGKAIPVSDRKVDVQLTRQQKVMHIDASAFEKFRKTMRLYRKGGKK